MRYKDISKIIVLAVLFSLIAAADALHTQTDLDLSRVFVDQSEKLSKL